MCGIIGGLAQRNIQGILLEGLKRLEYRGYDSAGLAILDDKGHINLHRQVGNVSKLVESIDQPMQGDIGIAHTRWATHGGVTLENAHPHVTHEELAIVHNGIIENYVELREELKNAGYSTFASETDTEVLLKLIHYQLRETDSLLVAVQEATKKCKGHYGALIMHHSYPDRLIAARSGSPLVIGLGIGENFIASDQYTLLSVTNKFQFLNDGDVAEIKRDSVSIFDREGHSVERTVLESQESYSIQSKDSYEHYMLKEIYEQPTVIRRMLSLLHDAKNASQEPFGPGSRALFAGIDNVVIVACGTSYHAGLLARYWLEDLVGISCQVEIASEFRYRKSVTRPNSLFISISQSGETADTLGALRHAKTIGFEHFLAICNVAGSSLTRESNLSYITNAGTEIGVASTKCFTSQLVGALLLSIEIGAQKGMSDDQQREILEALTILPSKIEEVFNLKEKIKNLAMEFIDKHHSLFLGRGEQYPIALEGALKLKEISYIHAEAYAAGELKHGPLALIDTEMPVVIVAPNDQLLEKLKSNIQEVKARGGMLYVFTNQSAEFVDDDTLKVINLPDVNILVAPILYNVALQLMSYFVARFKGTDIDQPRNLAKSVTVE